jgi:hypothetical protein
LPGVGEMPDHRVFSIGLHINWVLKNSEYHHELRGTNKTTENTELTERLREKTSFLSVFYVISIVIFAGGLFDQTSSRLLKIFSQ